MPGQSFCNQLAQGWYDRNPVDGAAVHIGTIKRAGVEGGSINDIVTAKAGSGAITDEGLVDAGGVGRRGLKLTMPAPATDSSEILFLSNSAKHQPPSANPTINDYDEVYIRVPFRLALTGTQTASTNKMEFVTLDGVTGRVSIVPRTDLSVVQIRIEQFGGAGGGTVTIPGSTLTSGVSNDLTVFIYWRRQIDSTAGALKIWGAAGVGPDVQPSGSPMFDRTITDTAAATAVRIANKDVAGTLAGAGVTNVNLWLYAPGYIFTSTSADSTRYWWHPHLPEATPGDVASEMWSFITYSPWSGTILLDPLPDSIGVTLGYDKGYGADDYLQLHARAQWRKAGDVTWTTGPAVRLDDALGVSLGHRKAAGRITGLSPSTDYEIRVQIAEDAAFTTKLRSSDSAGEHPRSGLWTFRTPPAVGDVSPWQLVFTGCNQFRGRFDSGHAFLRALEQAEATGVPVVAVCEIDDVVYHSEQLAQPSWTVESFAAVYQALDSSPFRAIVNERVPLIRQAGDHDFGPDDPSWPMLGSTKNITDPTAFEAASGSDPANYAAVWDHSLGDTSLIVGDLMANAYNTWNDLFAASFANLPTPSDPGGFGYRTEFYRAFEWGRWLLYTHDMTTHINDDRVGNVDDYFGDEQAAHFSAALAASGQDAVCLISPSVWGDAWSGDDTLSQTNNQDSREGMFALLRADGRPTIALSGNRHRPLISREIALTTLAGATGPVPNFRFEVTMCPVLSSFFGAGDAAKWGTVGNADGTLKPEIVYAMRTNTTGIDPPARPVFPVQGTTYSCYGLASFAGASATASVRDSFTGEVLTNIWDGSGSVRALITMGSGGKSWRGRAQYAASGRRAAWMGNR